MRTPYRKERDNFIHNRLDGEHFQGKYVSQSKPADKKLLVRSEVSPRFGCLRVRIPRLDANTIKPLHATGIRHSARESTQYSLESNSYLIKSPLSSRSIELTDYNLHEQQRDFLHDDHSFQHALRHNLDDILHTSMVDIQVTEDLLSIVSAECSDDGKWINPSPRALHYVPRALISLGRWEEFMSKVCNLHFIFEYTLEFGVFEYAELLHSAARRLEAAPAAANLLALSATPLHVPRSIQALREHADFAAAHAEELGAHPEHVFRLALAHGG